MINNTTEMILFYMNNRQEIQSLVESDLQITMKRLMTPEQIKDFRKPTFLFSCDSIDDESTIGVTIGLTYIGFSYDDNTTRGEVEFVENRISISLYNIYEYLSIVVNRIEVPEEAIVALLRFCCIHESVHYIQAWIDELDSTMTKEPEELFIINGKDVREDPQNHDVYGRYIEIKCINQCNELFEKKTYGSISELYMIFSMVGLISIELDGDEYERRLNQLGEMLRNKCF